MDSTGYAIVGGASDRAELGDEHMALVVRGVALASRCEGDLSLLELLLASELDIRRFLDRRELDAGVNVRCVFINATASVRDRRADRKWEGGYVGSGRISHGQNPLGRYGTIRRTFRLSMRARIVRIFIQGLPSQR